MFTKENIPDSIKESFLKENYDIVDDDIIRRGLYTKESRVSDPLLDEPTRDSWISTENDTKGTDGS